VLGEAVQLMTENKSVGIENQAVCNHLAGLGVTPALAPLRCPAAGSSMGSRSAAGGMGSLLEGTCLPTRWTTAAVATCPPCGSWAGGRNLWTTGGRAEASLLHMWSLSPKTVRASVLFLSQLCSEAD